ncbi:MAG: uracil-DNA glycosylase [Acidobacteria bacterium]|nr:uracil-DNA glycosylase [Acidobacteriota bacterium]
MDEQTQARELLKSLAEDLAESAAYLRELGVEGLEGLDVLALEAPAPEEPQKTQAPVPAALRRNATAEQQQPPPPQRTTLPPPPPPTTSQAARPQPTGSSLPPPLQTRADMSRKPVRKPSPDPPEPRETLFGDITPQDELSLGQPGETFEDIRADIGECVRCPLHEGRKHIVHTEGKPGARLMFVGEAPGADEDESGRPFVGRAGQLLNKIIEAIGLKREDVLIGNVNRCRPPGNRTPTIEEARTCKPFLLREINVARPEVIVVLGNTAMKNLLDTKEGITRLRGQFQDYRGIKVMPTFHPAYLLRDPSKKREVWDDMKKVRDYLNETKGSRQ